MGSLVDLRAKHRTSQSEVARAAYRELWGISDVAAAGAATRGEWKSREEYDFYRHECRDHFWPFFLHAWGTLNGPYARKWWIDRAEIGEPLARWFEFQVREWERARARHEKSLRKVMVMVTRDFGKTTLISQAGMLWLQLQDPNLSCFIGGEKEDVAKEVLKGIRAVLDGTDRFAQFSSLYGDWMGSDGISRRDSLTHNMRTLTTRKEPSFGIWGVETGLTGRHPDVLCLDDPNTYERQQSQNDWFEVVHRHVASLAPVPQPDGLFILVGTPYAEKDHLNKTLERDGIATLTGLPMKRFAPRPDGQWHVFHFPGRDLELRPTVPNVWPEKRMADFERENPDRYAAQILLRPELSEHNPLTMEQIRDCLVNESDIPMRLLRFTLHIDTAFKDDDKKKHGDESVYEIWGHYRDGSGDVVFIEGYSSALWRGEDFYNSLVTLLQRYHRMGRKIAIITDELSPGKSGMGRVTLESFCHGKGIARPGEFIELSRGGKKKIEQRIIPAASYWADGHVKLIRGAPGLEKLMEQMSQIGRSEWDDWADAGADVFHPSVYRRQIKLGTQSQEQPAWLATPQDAILKNSSNPDELRRLYDAWVNRDELDFEPV